ncbi:hypothetical protein [Undibacterium sp. YM2]|uniref:hypothetical protein n=1 Tax=Undibacterium sp. YM2 TaxID=2058625 RepID=UPI0013899CCA|nr:hypothetical protein [Undibacterium sp. YM2]
MQHLVLQHGQVLPEHGLLSHGRGNEQKQYAQDEIEKLAGVLKQASFRIRLLTEAASMDIRKIRTAFFQHLKFYSLSYSQHSFVLLLRRLPLLPLLLSLLLPLFLPPLLLFFYKQTIRLPQPYQESAININRFTHAPISKLMRLLYSPDKRSDVTAK